MNLIKNVIDKKMLTFSELEPSVSHLSVIATSKISQITTTFIIIRKMKHYETMINMLEKLTPVGLPDTGLAQTFSL